MDRDLTPEEIETVEWEDRVRAVADLLSTLFRAGAWLDMSDLDVAVTLLREHGPHEERSPFSRADALADVLAALFQADAWDYFDELEDAVEILRDRGYGNERRPPKNTQARSFPSEPLSLPRPPRRLRPSSMDGDEDAPEPADFVS